MNTPSPLVPQGVTPARGKSSFFFKVLMILTVHVVVIGGMLLQGCKDTKDNAANPPDATANNSDTMPPATNPSSVSNASTSTASPQAPLSPAQPLGQPAPGAIAQQPPVAAPGAPGAPAVAPLQPVPPPATIPAAPVAPETSGKEYVIASGDTLGAIAKKNGISLKSLMEANAGVNPKKLQVGQKIQIPASSGAVASAGGATATSPDVASGDATVYTVKSGDTLGKIAKLNHTTYKKIMALNDLKTTSIKIGQKLKIPAAKTAATETPAPATLAPVVPVQPTPPPVTTAATSSTTSSN